MTLLNVVNRKMPPTPWEEGENIPWNDPAFSERMLKEHLTQGHDAASRRFVKIDEQAQWIHRRLLAEQPTRILDLACGPGLYTSRLARLGHECVGVDYAPAAVTYGRDAAAKEGLACTYVLADVREAELGDAFGLVMMISGQINVFRRGEAQAILARAAAALTDGGLVVLEPQTFATVEGHAKMTSSWGSSPGGGLFSDKTHLSLEEHFWHAESNTSTTRYFIVDAATGEVARYALSCEAYTDEELTSLLADTGFEDVEIFPSLVGVEDESQSYNMVIVGRKPEA